MTDQIAELKRLLAEAAPIFPVCACCKHCDVIFGSNGETYLATMTDAGVADPAYVPHVRFAARALIVELLNYASAIIARIEALERLREAGKKLRFTASWPTGCPKNKYREFLDAITEWDAALAALATKGAD